MSRIAAFDWAIGGHRGPYLELFARAIGAEILPVGTKASLSHILKPQTLLFSTCEDYFGRFVFWALLRRFLGRTSIGILIRAERTLNPTSWKHWLKRWLLTLIRVTGSARMVTILSHDFSPESSRISDGWFWDPQFWDLEFLHPQWRAYEVSESIRKQIDQHRSGRKLVIALGTQSLYKGMLWFSELYQRSEEIRKRFLFVNIGTKMEVPRESLDRFRAVGGLVIDQYVLEPELIALLGMSDWVWCCYRPDYDQSSGIFGRALQMGRKVIVRQNSYLERVSCLGFGVAIPYGDENASERIMINAPENSATGVSLNGVLQLEASFSGKWQS